MKHLISDIAHTIWGWKVQNLAIAVALGAAMCCASALAQSGAGAIQGTVQDSTGAVIPGAAVHVVNQGTGLSIVTKSNGTGFYSVPSLFTGNYTVTFAAKGMKTYEISISLQVAQTAVINPSLTPGAVTEQVTVSGEAMQLVTYDSPTISAVLENSQINQLPMNGRSLLTLTSMTTPGVELVAGSTRADSNQASALEYVQDGAPMVDRDVGGSSLLPDPDAIQEVRLDSADSTAQFATPGTAIITTKSGTNQLHGTAFETMRNNYIGIAKSRQNPSNYAAPHLVRNEFGASVGGPIVVPRLYHGKNKSFFFFAFERYSLRSDVSDLDEVPTVAMRNGDFSDAYNSAGVLQVIYDSNTTNPTTFQRQPFPNNMIPMSRISPLAKTLYPITPLPTSSANPYVSSNIITAAPNNETQPSITFRLDQDFNQNNRAYLSYTSVLETNLGLVNYPSDNPATLAGNGFPAGAAGEAVNPHTVYSFALGYAHVFSPTFFSETVLGNQWEGDLDEGGGNPNLNYNTLLGLPDNFGEVGFPQIGFYPDGGGNIFMNYSGTQFNWGMNTIDTNLDENLTKTQGRHQLFFGGRYRHERLGVTTDQRRDVAYFNLDGSADVDPTSGASYNPLANTGAPAADFFLGAAYEYVVNQSPPRTHFSDQEFDTYFQDNFHVNSRLTINTGIRWEVHPSWTERNNLENQFDLSTGAIVLRESIPALIARGVTTQAIITNLENLGEHFETPQEAGLPNSLLYNSNFTFSPRLGLAYMPFGVGGRYGTVLRGGFGRYIYPTPVRTDLAGTNEPYENTYSENYTTANQAPDDLPNYLLRTPLAVIAGQNSANVVNTGGTNSILPGINQNFFNPHFPPNYVTQANFTIEQPLKWSSFLRVTYLFDHGLNLTQPDAFNTGPSSYVYEEATGQLPPTGVYSTIATDPYNQTLYGSGLIEEDKNGYSNDSSLQLNYQHLYKSGYAFQIYYVYSRAMRMGGAETGDTSIYPAADYIPGVSPTQGTLPWQTSKALNRFQNYQIDSAIPEHHVSFNGIYALPIGRGQRFLSNSNRLVNELIGGYQIAGDGNVLSQYFELSTANLGPTNPIQVYKHAHKITDCRSGVCYPEYLWFNGYLAPTVINATTKGVSGLPSNYAPYQTPINNTPGGANYGTNDVTVTLSNGKTSNVAYSPGPGVSPYSHRFLSGPFNYDADLSVFKVFPITERMNLRVNIDAFNALNIQGYTNPNTTDGTEAIVPGVGQASSHWTPRQVQFTARFTF